MAWNKSEDTLSIESPAMKNVSSKREALSELAKVYHPLGLVSPTTLVAKILYREMCEAKSSWDTELSKPIKRRWPPTVTLEPCQETSVEAKVARRVLAATTTTKDRDEFDELLGAHNLVRVIRVGAWVRRFVNNSKRPVRQRGKGPLKAAEI